MKISIGNDHAGPEYKKEIIVYVHQPCICEIDQTASYQQFLKRALSKLKALHNHSFF